MAWNEPESFQNSLTYHTSAFLAHPCALKQKLHCWSGFKDDLKSIISDLDIQKLQWWLKGMALSGHNNVMPMVTINISVWVWNPYLTEGFINLLPGPLSGCDSLLQSSLLSGACSSLYKCKVPFLCLKVSFQWNSANILEITRNWPGLVSKRTVT